MSFTALYRLFEFDKLLRDRRKLRAERVCLALCGLCIDISALNDVVLLNDRRVERRESPALDV